MTDAEFLEDLKTRAAAAKLLGENRFECDRIERARLYALTNNSLRQAMFTNVTTLGIGLFQICIKEINAHSR
jgi:hypothetical protein